MRFVAPPRRRPRTERYPAAIQVVVADRPARPHPHPDTESSPIGVKSPKYPIANRSSNPPGEVSAICIQQAPPYEIPNRSKDLSRALHSAIYRNPIRQFLQ